MGVESEVGVKPESEEKEEPPSRENSSLAMPVLSEAETRMLKSAFWAEPSKVATSKELTVRAGLAES